MARHEYAAPPLSPETQALMDEAACFGTVITSFEPMLGAQVITISFTRSSGSEVKAVGKHLDVSIALRIAISEASYLRTELEDY